MRTTTEYTTIRSCGHEYTNTMWGLEDLPERQAALQKLPCLTCMETERLISGKIDGTYTSFKWDELAEFLYLRFGLRTHHFETSKTLSTTTWQGITQLDYAARLNKVRNMIARFESI